MLHKEIFHLAAQTCLTNIYDPRLPTASAPGEQGYYDLKAPAETLLQKMMYTESVFCRYCIYIQIPALACNKS